MADMPTLPRGSLKSSVAGGGISGAAIALFLSCLDTNVTILESRASRTTATEGGMLMLAPNGMNVMNGLDLAHKLLQRDTGVQVPWLTINDSAGGLIGNVPQGSVERYGFASTMIMRWDIHEVLLDEVERNSLDIRWNAHLDATEESDDGIIVHWNENGLPKEKKADLLIGADGIWSQARLSMFKSLGLPEPKPTYSGLVGIGTIVDVDTIPGFSGFLSLERPCVMIYGRQGFVGMALLDEQGKKVGWWTNRETPERAREEWQLQKEQLFREVGGFNTSYSSSWGHVFMFIGSGTILGLGVPVPQLLAAAEASGEELSVWPVFEVEKLSHWHSKRTVLIGDAAHAMPPYSGQGASQSLEDAGHLAYLLRQYLEKRSSAAQGLNVEELTSTLATFQAARQPRVDAIVEEANRRGSQKKEHSAFGQFMRKWIMKIVFFFMQEGSVDGWFGYKVPGMDEWAALRASESTRG
ncbi:FAD/NAD(P)-binding domain-containing protein [Melanogaster broomeanus]|nr:FAD/NAD(P)-binding domain-containing protein [Melanogaster broomeanus]